MATGNSPLTTESRDVRTHDVGMTLVEVLVSIVLTGTLAVAGLVTLRATVRASTIDRDHANAHAWLQTASDVLYGSPRFDCGSVADTREDLVRDFYQSIVQSTENPEQWPAEKISIVPLVKFWDGTSTYQNVCYDDAGINLQLITIEVRDPNNRVVESVEIVKG